MKGRSMQIRPPRRLLAGVAGLAAVATVAACGGGSSPSDPATPTGGATSSSPAAAGRGFGRGAPPAASGTIAAVTGTTMQVQSRQNGQVAVHWTATTKFTQQVKVAASSIEAGDCVTATAGPGTSPTATSFAASTLSVSAPTDGSCTGRDGQFGGGGARPSGFPTGARPSGFPTGGPPSGFPTGAARNRGRAGFGAIARGSVTSVSGNTLVIAAREFGSGSSSPATSTTTVTLSSATTITSEKSATASAIKVGRCATARGSADSSGTVTATALVITDPANGQCGAFGSFGSFGGGDGGNGG
jgi:hypothetical protein